MTEEFIKLQYYRFYAAEHARVPQAIQTKSLVICGYCDTVSEARAYVREALGVLRGAAPWQPIARGTYQPLELARPRDAAGGRPLSPPRGLK